MTNECGVGAGDPCGVGASSSAASRNTEEEPMDEDEECIDGEEAPEEEAKEGDRERWMNVELQTAIAKQARMVLDTLPKIAGNVTLTPPQWMKERHLPPNPEKRAAAAMKAGRGGGGQEWWTANPRNPWARFQPHQPRPHTRHGAGVQRRMAAQQLPPGRREADQLLVLLLRQNGCPVPHGVSSVGQLSSDAVIQAVGFMIAGMDGSRPPPEALSTTGCHPAERFHACRLVASRVRDAGYSEPLSAHQLLYPGGEDTRRMLLDLLAMLPPDGAKSPPPELASGTGPPLLPEGGKERQQADDLLSSDVGGTAERGSADRYNDNMSPRSEGQEEEAARVCGGTDASSPQSAVAENVPETDAQEKGEHAVSESGSGEEDSPPSDAGGDAGDGPTALAGAGETGDMDGSEDPALPASPSGRQNPRGGSAASDIAEGLGSPSGSGKEALAKVSGRSTPSAEKGGNAVGERGGGQASRDGGGSDDNGGDDGAPVSHVSDELGNETESEEEDNVFTAEPSCEDATASVGTGVEAEEEGMTRDEASEGGSCKGDEGEGVPAEMTAPSTGGDDDVSAPGAGFVNGNGSGDTAPVGIVDPSDEPGEGEPESLVENPPLPSEALDEPLHQGAGEPARESGDGDCADPNGATAQGAAEPVAGPSGASGEDERSPGVPQAESEGDAEGGVCAVGDEEAAAVGLTANGGKPGGAVDAAEERGDSSASPSGEALPPEEGADVEGGKGGPQEEEEEEEEEEGTEDDVVFLQFEVEAKELELKRLLAEREGQDKAADELEKEVQRLGSLAEEREKHCRYAAKALELLPNAAAETSRMQNECVAAEARMHAAAKAFEKGRKPLEAVVRVQREKLARRKARCRALVTEMRGMYAECQEMSQQESALMAAARDMEVWESKARGEVVIGPEKGGDGDGSGSGSGGEAELGEEEHDSEEARKRRKAGAALRSHIDKRITSLCEDAAAQKQEIAISLTEVLDSRREANGAWELLGRAEALPEERIFSAAKQAKSGSGGTNKDRAKDLTEAYKHLHALGEVFSKIVEAMSEVGRREEECRSVERETEKMLSRQGGNVRLQLLTRDLERVKGDAFALEQRLDQALEEERLNQKASQETQDSFGAAQDVTRRDSDDNANEAVVEQDEQASCGNDTCGEVQDDDDDAEQQDLPLRAQEHGKAAESTLDVEVQDERSAAGGEERGEGEAPEQRGSGAGGDVVESDQEADFVGEDEVDNVWQ
ncbi:unnamed protein product [Ectocarpus sp. CCAP 1310/34]|nr:unnamed protein product [Ectocarpus sp. CCAP 1310/34]